jgi:hypothetical protein
MAQGNKDFVALDDHVGDYKPDTISPTMLNFLTVSTLHGRAVRQTATQ